MKKFIKFFIIALVAVLAATAFAGCGGASGPKFNAEYDSTLTKFKDKDYEVLASYNSATDGEANQNMLNDYRITKKDETVAFLHLNSKRELVVEEVMGQYIEYYKGENNQLTVAWFTSESAAKEQYEWIMNNQLLNLDKETYYCGYSGKIYYLGTYNAVMLLTGLNENAFQPYYNQYVGK